MKEHRSMRLLREATKIIVLCWFFQEYFRRDQIEHPQSVLQVAWLSLQTLLSLLPATACIATLGALLQTIVERHSSRRSDMDEPPLKETANIPKQPTTLAARATPQNPASKSR